MSLEENKTEITPPAETAEDVAAGIQTEQTADPSPEEKAGTTQKPKKKKRTAKDYAIAFFIKLGITALAVFLLLRFVVGVHVCHTNSAYPAIKDGEFCLTFRWGELRQGTMIVYEHDGETRYGRVIASAGEQVNIAGDSVTVNGYALSENVVYPTSPEGSAISYPYTVPENSVFVLNDFRSDISDSRTYGGIPLEDVEGAVIFTMKTRGI